MRVRLVPFLTVLILCSVANFDFGDFPDEHIEWSISQQPECAQLTLADRYIDEPSDGNCVAATMIMLRAMNVSGTDCVRITNTGWIPASQNPMTRRRVVALLASDAPY